MTQRQRALNAVRNGVLDGPTNLALDRQWLALAADNRLDCALRLYRFTPTVSVGRHQALARELRLDYCRDKGIAIVRRLAGGGALYLDQNQLGFSVVTRGVGSWCTLPLDRLLLKLAWVVAGALRALDIPAYAAPPNDIEVRGRKIGAVYVARERHCLLLHGTVLLDADVRTMLEALRVPTEKLTAQGFATARTRFTTINELCNGALPVEKLEGALTAGFEHMLGAQANPHAMEELDTKVGALHCDEERSFAGRIVWDTKDQAIESVIRTRTGATLRAQASFSGNGAMLERVEFATDAHLEPADLLFELADVLAGLPVTLSSDAVRHLMHRRAAQSCGFAGSDIVGLLRELAAKHNLREQHGFSTREVNSLMVHDPARQSDIVPLLGAATAMLVPYCAKPAWCGWRARDGCGECGLCEVGNAYRFARERGMQVTTITNYEHLVSTLKRMKDDAVPAYVGMCCGNFFVKRQRAFAEAGIPAVLMDVSGANCYELKQEDDAYAGMFRAEARIDRELLVRVVAFVPQR